MKKTIVLLAALVLFVGFSGIAMADDFKGEVTKVKGDEVTIKVTKGEAAKIKVGSEVEVKVEKSGKPKKSGSDMLMGC